MKLQTTVDISPASWQIGYEDKILMLGSCFADSMGEQMMQRGLNVTVNPFGTLYNPLSIAQAINFQLNDFSQLSTLKIWHCQIIVPFRAKNSQLIIHHEGLWHSMAHHGSFSRPTKEETEQAVKASVETMQKALSESSVIIVTFGTAWVYEMNGAIVANCHKLPESSFTRRRLSVEEIVAAWQPILDRYPDKHWIFTVSPIRHIRDGLHENQLSKATLLMAVERLVNQSVSPQDGLSAKRSVLCQAKPVYFPSYEIMLDELRDYRFYADDLVHPSSLAVNYIWERFADTFCTPQTRNEMNIRLKQFKQTQHRPLH
jgi:hypothetical protein